MKSIAFSIRTFFYFLAAVFIIGIIIFYNSPPCVGDSDVRIFIVLLIIIFPLIAAIVDIINKKISALLGILLILLILIIGSALFLMSLGGTRCY